MSELDWDIYLALSVIAWLMWRLVVTVVNRRTTAACGYTGIIVLVVIPLWNAWSDGSGPSDMWCTALLLAGGLCVLLGGVIQERARRREYRQLML